MPGFLSSRPIGSAPPPSSPAGECCPPWFRGGGGHTRLREMDWADPIRTRGQTQWYSRYSTKYIIHLLFLSSRFPPPSFLPLTPPPPFTSTFLYYCYYILYIFVPPIPSVWEHSACNTDVSPLLFPKP